MPSRKVVTARISGICSNDFAHPRQIRPGDRVLVTTFFPRDEAVDSFGADPLTRTRVCQWCLQEECERGERGGLPRALLELRNHQPGYICPVCGALKDRAFWR